MDTTSSSVTLLFSDIQDSTVFWDNLGDGFHPILERHNLIIRDYLRQHQGTEIKTEGDAFMLAFNKPSDALYFALRSQTALGAEIWPEKIGQLKVRMGLHTGKPIYQSSTTRGHLDYFGPVVNRAARVSSAAWGGQVLISEPTYEGLGEIKSNFKFKDFGFHWLKGLEQPERLFQPFPAHLEFPTEIKEPRTLKRKTGFLPVPQTSFIGREKLLEDLSKWLGKGPGLYTLLGPGGCGKTRVALKLACLFRDDFPGGTWFVDLSNARNISDVVSQFVRTFDLEPKSGNSGNLADPVDIVSGVLELLEDSLLVLDNFEQVVESCREFLFQVIKKSPKTRFLITSRFLINLPGERVWNLEPMAVPQCDIPLDDLNTIASWESVQFFINRGQDRNPDLFLTSENAKDIAQICLFLEGMPLALELAAGRLGLMSPEEILNKLKSSSRILTSTQIGVPARQKSMEQAFLWSFDLLNREEKILFLGVSLLEGSLSLELGEELFSQFVDGDCLEIFQSLVEKSFLHRFTSLGKNRFRIFKPLKEMGRQQLEENSSPLQKDLFLARINQIFYLKFSCQSQNFFGEGVPRLVQNIELELDNIFFVYKNWVQMDDYVKSGEIAATAAWFFNFKGWNRFAQCVLHHSINRLSENTPLRLFLRNLQVERFTSIGDYEKIPPLIKIAKKEGKVLNCPKSLSDTYTQEGIYYKTIGEYKKAKKSFNQALKAIQKVDHLSGEALVFSHLGDLEREQGNFSRSLFLYQKGEKISEQLKDQRLKGRFLRQRGNTLWNQGSLDKALELYLQSETIHKTIGNEIEMGHSIMNQACIHYQKKDSNQALAVLDRAEKIFKAQNHKPGLANLYNTKGLVQSDLEKWDDAQTHFLDSISLYRQIGNVYGLAITLQNLGSLYCRLKNFPQSITSLLECLEIYQKTAIIPGVASVLGHLGNTYFYMGDLKTAGDYFKKSFALQGKEGDLCMNPEIFGFQCNDLFCRIGEMDPEEIKIQAGALLKNARDYKIDKIKKTRWYLEPQLEKLDQLFKM